MKTSGAVKAANILVVDDEPEITEIIEAFLDNAGYDVKVENSPLNALEAAREYKPDLILLDIMMPGTDGYSVCNAVKEDPHLSDTPVIFLTGKDSKDDQGRSFQVGGDMFIKKPFSCERLLEIVNIVLLSVGKN
ncbi:MAG: response regulator [candidate division Zixibacteria bacterium]|nr:response regulator [candidate division Zixibacteria bacterium]